MAAWELGLTIRGLLPHSLLPCDIKSQTSCPSLALTQAVLILLQCPGLGLACSGGRLQRLSVALCSSRSLLRAPSLCLLTSLPYASCTLLHPFPYHDTAHTLLCPFLTGLRLPQVRTRSCLPPKPPPHFKSLVRGSSAGGRELRCLWKGWTSHSSTVPLVVSKPKTITLKY